MMMKICTQCGRRLQSGKQCPCNNSRHKLYNKNVRDKNKNAFYHSRQWRALTDVVKTRANGLDEYAFSTGMIVAGNTVHHIYTIDERPDLKLSTDNLIYVSASTHNWIHSEYDKGLDVKRDLQAKLLEIIGRG